MKIIAGKFKGHKIHAPKSASTRPTQSITREALFNICQNKIEGSLFLDLFAGSGAMGIEALSRGATKAVCVENHKSAIGAIKKNIASLQIEEDTILIPKEIFIALKFLKAKEMHFDIIYLDPPYKMELFKKKKILENIFSFSLLKDEGDLFLEDDSKKPLDLPFRFCKSRKFGKSFLHHWSK